MLHSMHDWDKDTEEEVEDVSAEGELDDADDLETEDDGDTVEGTTEEEESF